MLQALLADLRSACEEIVHGAGRAKRNVDGSRRALKAALAAHQEACRCAVGRIAALLLLLQLLAGAGPQCRLKGSHV
jgi:hypothetical protein